MILCPVCGDNVPEGTKFCSSCGAAIEQPQPENPAPVGEEKAEEAVVEALPVEEELPSILMEESTPAPEEAAIEADTAETVPMEAIPTTVVEELPPKKLLLSTFQYILLMLLFSIPVIGLIFLFVWGVGQPKNPSLKRFAAAVLILRLLLTAFAVGALLVLLVLKGAAVQALLDVALPSLRELWLALVF